MSLSASPRYVDGEIFSLRSETNEWVHFGPVPADEEPGGLRDWVANAKAAYAPERVGEVVKALDNLKQEPQADDSTVYTGTTTVAVIGNAFAKGYYPETNNWVGMTLPDGIDPATPVKVRITIGANGILNEWTGTYGDDDHEFVFTAKYSDVGSTEPIEKPETFVEGVRGSK